MARMKPGKYLPRTASKIHMTDTLFIQVNETNDENASLNGRGEAGAAVMQMGLTCVLKQRT